MDSTAQFYDALASDYHFIFPDWQQSARKQGAILHQLIQSLDAGTVETLWDCTCGIGTQALGLAEYHYAIHGTDLSAAAIARARAYTRHFDTPLVPTFAVRDLLDPPSDDRAYDLVISCDNSIAHFLDDASLSRALDSMISGVRPDGHLLISLRDYDWIAQVRPQSTLPSVTRHDGARVIIFQVWDWEADGSAYDMTMFIVQQGGESINTKAHRTRLRALQRETLEAQLRAKGLLDIRWHMPDASGYYQPIITARRPS